MMTIHIYHQTYFFKDLSIHGILILYCVTVVSVLYTLARTHMLFLKSILSKGDKGTPDVTHECAAPFLVTVPRNLTRDYDCSAWRPSIFVRGRFTVCTLLCENEFSTREQLNFQTFRHGLMQFVNLFQIFHMFFLYVLFILEEKFFEHVECILNLSLDIEISRTLREL